MTSIKTITTQTYKYQRYVNMFYIKINVPYAMHNKANESHVDIFLFAMIYGV